MNQNPFAKFSRDFSKDEKIRSRTAFDTKIEWRGLDSKFAEYMNLIEAWMRQTQQGYLTNAKFIESYVEEGWNTAKKYAPGISYEQFRNDRQGLYGALQSSTRNSNRGRHTYLNSYQRWMV